MAHEKNDSSDNREQPHARLWSERITAVDFGSHLPQNSYAWLRSLLNVAASIPSSIPWAVAPIDYPGVILLCDSREEATISILEGVASQFGEVLETTSVDSTTNGRELIGCLIRPSASDLETAAARLRAAYALATDAGANEADAGDDGLPIRPRIDGRPEDNAR